MRIIGVLVLVTLLQACSGEQAAQVSGIADARGRWVVVNYWAQWCKPCIEEIPELNALSAARDDIAVLGVNYDGASGEELRAQEQRLGVVFPTLSRDPAAELGIPRPAVLPTTLVLNPEGKLAETLVGPQTQASLLAIIGNANKKTGP